MDPVCLKCSANLAGVRDNSEIHIMKVYSTMPLHIMYNLLVHLKVIRV